MTEWPYPYRRRWAGAEVGCLLCPTMVQAAIPQDEPRGPRTIRQGMLRHIEWLHPDVSAVDRVRITNDAVKGRPRRHDAT